MSWKCTKCETFNKDVSPVCTVCYTLAPVVESYLSSKLKEDSIEYNVKLEEVHRLEKSGEYEKMLNVALEAIAVYKENGSAVEKAKQALKHLNEVRLEYQLNTLLFSTIEKKDYLTATAIIHLIENFNLGDSDFTSLKSEFDAHILKEKEIDEILKESYTAIISLDHTKASKIIESGLEKYPLSKLLQLRRDDISNLKLAINNLQKKTEDKKRTFPKPPHRPMEPKATESTETPKEVINLNIRRKYPKPKRK